MARDERGYIVVETIGSFLLFVLAITSILSLINIVAIQARIHYAITQTAQTVSMYCYVLDVTGMSDAIVASAGKAEEVQTEADTFKDNLNGLLNGLEGLDPDQVGAHGEAALNQVEGWADQVAADPKQSLQLLLNYGLQEGSSAVFEQMVRPLVGRYLANGGMSGDEYLKTFYVSDGLDGLDFYDFSLFSLGSSGANDSQLLTADGDVKIVVEYDVDYTFGALLMPTGTPKLHVTQEVLTKAWLGGKGEGYTP